VFFVSLPNTASCDFKRSPEHRTGVLEYELSRLGLMIFSLPTKQLHLCVLYLLFMQNLGSAPIEPETNAIVLEEQCGELSQ
jgi:hypothetical protein